MFTESRKFRIIFQIFSALCLLAAVVCIVCDLAVYKRLTWSLYVIAALVFVWVSASPAILCKRWRILLSLGAFTIALLPYLNVTARIAGGAWFVGLALPNALVGIAALWITWVLLRFRRINWWYMSAVLVFLYGVVVYALCNGLTNAYLGMRLFSVGEIISLIACSAVSVLLCVIGYGGHPVSRKQPEPEEE